MGPIVGAHTMSTATMTDSIPAAMAHSKLGRSAQHLGPLVIAFVLGVFLVGASAQSYRDARLAAQLVAERQGVASLFRIRAAIPRGIPSSAALQKLLDQNVAHGLTYIGIIDRGKIVSSAGTALLSDMEPVVGSPAFGGGRVRLMSPGEGREDVPGGAAAKGQGDKARRLFRPSVGGPGTEAFPLPAFAMPSNMWPVDAEVSQFVIEVAPVGDGDIVRRATIVLILCCGTALFLVAAAAVLWHSTRETEKVTQRLLAQNHLARLGEMSAVLAHELRNPLAALKGHAQLLAERLRDSELKPRIDRVVNEAIRLENLTTSLLQFASSGTIRVRAVSPGDLLGRAVAATAADRIEARTAGAPALWTLDDARLEQVLVNLLENALAVTPPSEKVVAEVSQMGDQLVYDIRDRGPGVPAGDRLRIFDAFHTTKMRGTGLGLSMSKRIVDLHRGYIEVGDAMGGGASFRVVLPPHERAASA